MLKVFDSHFHIIDPTFPLIANQGYLPEPFSLKDYYKKCEHLDLQGGAVVSGSFQGLDHSYIKSALHDLGENYFGVINIDQSYSLKTLKKLNEIGVRGVRFNLVRGLYNNLNEIIKISEFIQDQFGWHTELYILNKDLKFYFPKLIKIRRLSIDHLGLTKEGLKYLYRLVEKGCRVKASGFGRLDFDPIPIMNEIYRLNPSALMFGTDLPCTRSPRAFTAGDVELIKDHFSHSAQQRIFFKNGMEWYQKTDH